MEKKEPVISAMEAALDELKAQCYAAKCDPKYPESGDYEALERVRKYISVSMLFIREELDRKT